MYKRNRASLCPLILIGEADGSSSVSAISSATNSLCRIGSFPLLFYLVEMVDPQMKKMCSIFSIPLPENGRDGAYGIESATLFSSGDILWGCKRGSTYHGAVGTQDIIIKEKGDESAWPMASGRASREVWSTGRIIILIYCTAHDGRNTR